jgi:hypothetical protein
LISFCTTCANRAHQLKETFRVNAPLVAAHPDVEWVILNYSSRDDLDSFLADQLPAASGRIVYAKQRADRPWHASVAKNAAHRIGRGRFLFNLDCDNFIGDAIEVIRTYTAQGCRLLHLWSGLHQDGTYGRIGMMREIFHAVGGYDESFYPMGYQDRDLLDRVSAWGAPILQIPCETRLAVQNTKEESTRYCANGGYTWRDYDRMNMQRSRANLAAKRFCANVEVPWAELAVDIRRGQREG